MLATMHGISNNIWPTSHEQLSEFILNTMNCLNLKDYHLKEGEHIYIPKNTIHRIENTGNQDLIFIEIQLGENLREEDIIRLEDDYGRV